MSALHDALTAYLATRRALGTQLRWPERSLRKLVDFVDEEAGGLITIDVALRWVQIPVGIKPATRARYLGLVRGFAQWLHASDPRIQVPPTRLLPTGQRRPAPHIFTVTDLAALTRAACELRSRGGLRGWTYTTLVGLLAATGLRPGEALALNVADVDLVNGILAVRDTKFGKSRFVPLEASTLAALAAYTQRREDLRPQRETAAFLITERGTRVAAGAARHTFAKLCQSIGLRSPTGSKRVGRGPRLQDIRHTFATRRLIEWYRTGCDVERRIPSLATYLGHVRVVETYWYIQAVPELLQLATERLEANHDEGLR